MTSNQYEVVRETTIPASAATIHGLVHDFRAWQAWSPWEDLDPALHRTYSGPGAGVGAVYEWSGNRKAGQGRMEITDDVPSQRVVVALDFLKPFRASNTTTFAFEETDGGTRVTWSMVGTKTFMTKVLGIFKSMDAMIGPDFEKGLARLRSAAASD